jgi:hypothetical protein
VKTFLRYVWWIGVALLQLAVIVLVFAALKTRLESIVVSILGLIYVTVRSIALNQGFAVARLTIAFDRELTRILELIGEDPKVLRDRRAAAADAEDTIFSARLIITSIFLGIVSLICLVALFGAVGGS